DLTGESAAANDVGVVSNPNEPILSTGERIGGTAPADRNIISGNTLFSIDIDNGNLLQGNYIGIDKSGTSALANGRVEFFANAGADPSGYGQGQGKEAGIGRSPIS